MLWILNGKRHGMRCALAERSHTYGGKYATQGGESKPLGFFTGRAQSCAVPRTPVSRQPNCQRPLFGITRSPIGVAGCAVGPTPTEQEAYARAKRATRVRRARRIRTRIRTLETVSAAAGGLGVEKNVRGNASTPLRTAGRTPLCSFPRAQ